jgi:DNA-binding transcriptional ArsR family regulator
MMQPVTSISDPRLVRALAHPMRMSILSILEQRVASPKELALEMNAPLTHVSYHVRQLAELGLLKLVRTTPRRGAVEHHYRLEAQPKITEEAWRETPEIAKQALVSAVLGQVSARVNAAAANAGFSREGAHLNRLPVELDEQGWQEASEALEAMVKELKRIEDDARKRTKGAPRDRTDATVVTMLFEATGTESAESASGAWRTPSASVPAAER